MTTRCESQLVNSGFVRDIAASTTYNAQTFTPTVSHLITSAYFFAFRTGSPGILTTEIRTTSGNKPTATVLCSGTTDPSTLTVQASGEWREVTLGAGALLDKGTQYAIVWYIASGDSSNNVRQYSYNTASIYVGGASITSVDSGSTWTITATRDFQFQEWGVTPSKGSNITKLIAVGMI